MSVTALDAPQPAPRADAIARTLMRDVLRGRYKPGERIREQAVADRLGVSRGPVREALQVLEQEGMVENLPWRGARVVLLTLKEIEDLFLLTASLMGLLARLAAERATDAELDRFTVLVEEMAPTADPARPTAAQLRAAFRCGGAMAQMARSAHIAAHLTRISRLVYWQHRVLNTVDGPWRRQAVETWRNLARALRTRDPRKAERAVNAVDRHSRQQVLKIHRELGPAVYRLFG